jgi:serine/threonine protein kinase/tetratricopeptide (TPR) repeat protein
MKCPKCGTVNPADSKFCKECATGLGLDERPSFTKTLDTSTDELARGTLFAGRYEIIEELGVGGMGRVYRVFDSRIREEVALKLLRPEVAARSKTVERFRNEIRLARKIVHKNVCRMFDMGEEHGTQFITMEYVAGEDLKSFIRRVGQLPANKAVFIGREIAEGLTEAHKIGVIHRDLKPGNIMIDKDGDAKIMDFGIARSLAGGGTTADGAIVGTPEYMSPEQVDGKEADARTDIYALGVILFEMVTGRVPFEGQTPFSVATKQKTEPPPDPATFNSQLPEGLDRLILRCMEKPPEKRYQTADELLADLTAVEETVPKAERVPGQLPSRTRSRISRGLTVTWRPNKFVISVSALLILVGAGYLLWHNIIHPPTPPVPTAKPTLAFLSFKNNSGNAALDPWKENLPMLLAGGLDQSRYIKVLDDPTVYGILKKLNLQSAEKYTTEDLKTIAAEGGATHLLSGNYLEAGGKFIIKLSLIDAKTGTVLLPIQVEAQNRGEDIYNSIDGLVRKVKSALDIPEQAIDEATYKMVGDHYTRNPKALQAYVEGERLHQAGDYRNAITALEKAVELDPYFAMAYRQLGLIYGNRGDFFQKYKNLRKAYELRDRLPEKDRLLVEAGWYMLKEETEPKAHEIFKTIVERYPDDFQGRSGLAFTAGDEEEQIRDYQYLLNVQNQTGSWVVASNLVTLYCWKEDYQKARELYQEWVNAHPKDPWEHIRLAGLYELEKNLEAAAKEYDTAISLAPKDPWVRYQATDLDWIKGEPDKILQTEREIFKTPKGDPVPDEAISRMIKGQFKETHELNDKDEKTAIAEGRTNWQFADLYTARGKEFLQTGHPEIALEKFRQGLEYVNKEQARIPETGLEKLMHPQRLLMIWQACSLCDLGRIEEAENLYRSVEALIPHPNETKKAPRVCICMNTALVAGKIALARRDGPAAVKALEECLRKMPGEGIFGGGSEQAYVMDLLGDAYELDGQLARAAEKYGRIRALLNGRADWGAVYTRSFYKLGKLYERMGKKNEARKEFAKFLGLWKDADPGLPEVPDAKARLAALGT